ncbi:MAG: DnaD domain-containing protein [Bacillota bacterium]
MARSRNIKPGFFLNDRLAEVEPLGRLLFAGLWTIADREGRLEDRPKKIKAELLPYDDCDVDELLNALNQKGFILRYEAAGKKYIWIINFLKHQNPHKREVASTIPPAPDQNAEAPDHSGTALPCPSPEKASTGPADSFNLIPDSLNLIPDSFNPVPSATPATATATVPATAESVEKEFGRPLSPMELEQIAEWEKKYVPDLILEALKIAVLKGVFRLKYIDAILLDWEKANLRTRQDVLDYEALHRKKGRVPPGRQTVPKKDFSGIYEL